MLITYSLLRHKAWSIESLVETIQNQKKELEKLNYLLQQKNMVIEKDAHDSRQIALESIESVNKMQAGILATVTHELRTPLHELIDEVIGLNRPLLQSGNVQLKRTV